MRLELNTNGAWRVVISGLSRHDKEADNRYLAAIEAARMLAEISLAANEGKRGIKWRLVSEANGAVIEMCAGDSGWVQAYRPGEAA